MEEGQLLYKTKQKQKAVYLPMMINNQMGYQVLYMKEGQLYYKIKLYTPMVLHNNLLMKGHKIHNEHQLLQFNPTLINYGIPLITETRDYRENNIYVRESMLQYKMKEKEFEFSGIPPKKSYELQDMKQLSYKRAMLLEMKPLYLYINSKNIC